MHNLAFRWVEIRPVDWRWHGPTDEAVGALKQPAQSGSGAVIVQGPPGTAGTVFEHTQASESAVWVVNHNLGYRPAVEVFNEGWVRVLAGFQNPTLNQTIITFAQPMAGYARLN